MANVRSLFLTKIKMIIEDIQYNVEINVFKCDRIKTEDEQLTIYDDMRYMSDEEIIEIVTSIDYPFAFNVVSVFDKNNYCICEYYPKDKEVDFTFSMMKVYDTQRDPEDGYKQRQLMRWRRERKREEEIEREEKRKKTKEQNK